MAEDDDAIEDAALRRITAVVEEPYLVLTAVSCHKVRPLSCPFCMRVVLILCLWMSHIDVGAKAFGSSYQNHDPSVHSYSM